MALRRFSATCLSLVTACIVAGNGGAAIAAVLYDENFTGAAATTLNGQIPDVDQNGGFNTWRAHTHFTADGNMNAPANGSSATLPFIPTPGFIYTLSASFTGITGSAGTNTNWVALGFVEGVPPNPQATSNDTRFISGATVGKAWMLFRSNFASGGLNHQTLRGNADSGTTTAVDYTSSFTAGGDIDLKIVLDTTGATYTAEYFAKRPTDGAYSPVSAGALPLNAQDIGAVGIALSNAASLIDARITNFTLETNGPVIIPGDVDGNGTVNILDFNVIRDNLFNAATSRAQGDLNSDGQVNFTDFRLWKSVASAELLAEIGAFGVPEPTSVALSLAAGVALVSLRRRSASPAAISGSK
jgi:hypothetical protein